MTTTIDAMMTLFLEMLEKSGLAFKQHQYDGVKFCLNNELTAHHGVKGGIIADEMGLGKTLTAIGVMTANPKDNTLIVLPPVLLIQWQKEIFRATGIQALLYHGPQKKKITMRELMQTRFVITTYNAIRPSNRNANLLHLCKWDRLVFDEAHHLRNKNLSHDGAVMLKSDIRWLLTGTPVQNNAKDFHHLCAALSIDKNIYCDKSMANTIIDMFVLRRTKTSLRQQQEQEQQEQQEQQQEQQEQQAINLLDIIETITQVKWENVDEKRLAQEIHSTLGFSNVSSINGLYEKSIKANSVLIRMLRGRQCCTLPSLMDSNLAKFKLESKYQTTVSSKIDAVINSVVQNRNTGTGKLIFCHYRNEIDEIAHRLQEENVQTATFDGRTSGSERQRILTDPNISVIILQIQTGCEGLNLQEHYSEIYFVSPHWNPSVEAQAIGRCHRMGQTKQVRVFRFEMDGFDEQQDQEQQEQQQQQQQDKKTSISLDAYIRRVQMKKQGIVKSIMEKTNEEEEEEEKEEEEQLQ